MSLSDKKVGILMEGDFYEPEIFYYERRFAEEGIDLHFLTRLWGQAYSDLSRAMSTRRRSKCHESFEGMSDEELRSYDAIIVPSGMVSDRLRYTDDVEVLPPATEFLQASLRRREHPQGHHLPRHVAGGAGARTGARATCGRAQQPAWRRHQHGRNLCQRRCRRRRRPRYRTQRRPLPPLCPQDYSDAGREVIRNYAVRNTSLRNPFTRRTHPCLT